MVLDNLAVRKQPAVRAALDSPDFNPIELAFARLKAFIRKVLWHVGRYRRKSSATALPCLRWRAAHSSTRSKGASAKAASKRDAPGSAGAAGIRPRREQKATDAEARKRERRDQARRAEIDKLEARIAECEAAIQEIEQTMAAPDFYSDRSAAQPVIDRHQSLMWTVGDLMHQWEELQSAADVAAEASTS